MPLVYGQEERVSAWLARQMGLPAGNFLACIGWESRGELKAALAFEGYTGSNVFAHLASTVVLPRSLLKAGCAYAFKQLECTRVTFAVNDDNDDCLELMEALDVAHEATLRHGHPHGHTRLYALYPWNLFVQRLFKTIEVHHGR